MPSVAVPIVLPPDLAIKTAEQDLDFVPAVTIHVASAPVTVAMSFFEHDLSLSLMSSPLGALTVTVAVGELTVSLTVQGLTETPLSFFAFRVKEDTRAHGLHLSGAERQRA